MFEKIKSFLFKNTSTKQTVAKNSFWLSVSNFGGRLIKAAIVIYAARALGAPEYGVFSYAVTLAGFLTTFMDPGIASVLLRDGAKASDEERSEIFSVTGLIKVVLVAIGIAIIVLIGPYFTTLPGAKALLPAAAIILTFDSIREFLFYLLRSREKMEWEAGIFILTNFAIVGFGFALLLHNPSALYLAWGYAIGTAIGGIAAIIAVRDEIKKAFTRFSSHLVWPIIQSAWPFAITGALGLLFTNTDILIISWMGNAAQVGIYSAAIRIVQVLYIVPYIIQLSTLPLFSRLANKDNAKFRAALEQSVGLIFLVSLPLTVGGIILGSQIMSFIFGTSFLSGSLALRILLATLIFDYPGSIVVNAIFAYAHQKSLIWSSAIGGITNVAFDLLLIPRFGITGSAVATLIAQIVVNGYIWYMMKKINYFEVVPHLKKMIAAALLMGLATALLLFTGTNLIVNILISTTIYFLLLKWFHESSLGEIMKILRTASA